MRDKYLIMLDEEKFYVGVTDWRIYWGKIEFYAVKFDNVEEAKKALDYVSRRAYDCVGKKIEPSRIAIYEINYKKVGE